MADQSTVILLGAAEGRKVTVGESTLFLKLASEITDNKFSITEYDLPSFFPGPPPHQHNVFEHAWYVLEGELTVQLNKRTEVLNKGSFIFIPRRTVHGFSNNSGSPVKVLVVDMPGGFEHYYDDLQSAFGNGELIDQERMRVIQLQYDTYSSDHIF